VIGNEEPSDMNKSFHEGKKSLILSLFINTGDLIATI
jgi:hypothetical protein